MRSDGGKDPNEHTKHLVGDRLLPNWNERARREEKIIERKTRKRTATGGMRYAERGVIEGCGRAKGGNKTKISERTGRAKVRYVAVCGGRLGS